MGLWRQNVYEDSTSSTDFDSIRTVRASSPTWACIWSSTDNILFLLEHAQQRIDTTLDISFKKSW